MAASPAVSSFVVWDYVVFSLMLLVSAAIGMYYAVAGEGQRNSRDFLTGGRSMSAVPVAMSLTAGFMSAITVLATPSEVYRYGGIYGIYGISYILVVVVSSEIFMPVFYRLGITSTYEVSNILAMSGQCISNVFIVFHYTDVLQYQQVAFVQGFYQDLSSLCISIQIIWSTVYYTVWQSLSTIKIYYSTTIVYCTMQLLLLSSRDLKAYYSAWFSTSLYWIGSI